MLSYVMGFDPRAKPGVADCVWQTMADCGRLWQTMADYGRLWQTVADCGRLWQTVADCGRLWQTVAACSINAIRESKLNLPLHVSMYENLEL